jgi:hypothetical protein
MFRKAFLLLLLFSFDGNAQSLGLRFTDPEQLEGIPIASTPFSGRELPPRADLSGSLPPAGDQGNQASCVAWAVAYACKSYQESIEESRSLQNAGKPDPSAVFSPSFVYNQINEGVDEGSLFTDALNIISQKGAVRWAEMPYTEADFTTQPGKAQLESAKKYRIDFWRRVNIKDIKEVKAQLNSGYPVIIGATADRGFVDNGWKAAGKTDYTWKSITGEQLGGHAMLVAGYDDAKEAFKVLNSWGEGWGNRGYCWISYSLFPKVVKEGYVMKDALNAEERAAQPKETAQRSPLEDLRARFELSNVVHNVPDYQLGTVMRFEGFVSPPAATGKNIQIVIRFYYNDGTNRKGAPAGSLSPLFSMPDGSAACGTPKASAAIGATTWYATLPYNVLDVPRGSYDFYGNYVYQTTYLLAEPVLYIDDFAVQTGGLIPFFVNL